MSVQASLDQVVPSRAPAAARSGRDDDTNARLRVLLQRAGQGDLVAFMEFYDATCDLAYRHALLRLRDRTAAEEATRRRYLAAWQRAGEHGSSGLSPLAWLLSEEVGGDG